MLSLVRLALITNSETKDWLWTGGEALIKAGHTKSRLKVRLRNSENHCPKSRNRRISYLLSNAIRYHLNQLAKLDNHFSIFTDSSPKKVSAPENVSL
jgi:hypothetical protein